VSQPNRPPRAPPWRVRLWSFCTTSITRHERVAWKHSCAALQSLACNSRNRKLLDSNKSCGYPQLFGMSPDGMRWKFLLKKSFNNLRCCPKIRSATSYWFVAGVFILYDHVWPDEAGSITDLMSVPYRRISPISPKVLTLF
jgi:hypothetical protein